MAPPRKVIRQQLEIMTDYLEANKDMAKGLPLGAPASHRTTKQKWVDLAKKLNAAPGGSLKTPDGWKKYWFEWRHKCRKKATDARRYQSGSDSGRNRFIPLNDLEIRVLELSGQESIAPIASTSQQLNDFLQEELDSDQPLATIKVESTPITSKAKRNTISLRGPTDYHTNAVNESDDTRPVTPPPKWAIELEERRIAAEERMAEALSSMAEIMRSREERRMMLDERIADALTSIAGTVQDLSSGVQEAVQHLRQRNPLQLNGPGVKEDIFL